jgi:hypothetical protein
MTITTSAQMLDLADDLTAMFGDGFVVDMPADIHDCIELRTEIGGDFVRVLREDETLRILHLTANEAIKGEARLTGTLVAYVAKFVLDFAEIAF